MRWPQGWPAQERLHPASGALNCCGTGRAVLQSPFAVVRVGARIPCQAMDWGHFVATPAIEKPPKQLPTSKLHFDLLRAPPVLSSRIDSDSFSYARW